jgi:hypothetical protein
VGAGATGAAAGAVAAGVGEICANDVQVRQEIVAAKTHALIRKHRLTFYILTRCATQAEIEPWVGLKGTGFSPYINPAKLGGFSP